MIDYRQSVYNQVLSSDNHQLLLIFPTGFGKSKLAIDLIKKRCTTKSHILIVVPKNVLIDTWKAEFHKWNADRFLPSVTFTTYISFPKHAGHFSMVVFDECHHLTPRCQAALKYFTITNAVFLSATVSNETKMAIFNHFHELRTYSINIRKAIQEDILPDPTVYLLPLTLNDAIINQEIIKNRGKGIPITIPYSRRWKYSKIKDQEVHISCTQQQWYDDVNGLIDFYLRKKNESRNPQQYHFFQQMWLHTCGERLKGLARMKTPVVRQILLYLQHERTLTFCCDISQTEEVGRYCINSKNPNAPKVLEDFNSGHLDHITACAMLDEGANLVNCRIGIFANINASSRIITQRNGRLLRHQSPIIIIPYYDNTREAEIVQKMEENYNPLLIHTISSIDQIILN